jgi:hypothetical protein
MTTLTLQSISAAGSQQPQVLNQGTQVRVVEAAAAAGVSQAQNQRRAQAASTEFQKNEERTIQMKKRAEGNSAGREPEDETKKDEETEQSIAQDPSRGRLHRTA